jgi:hypothetical protein
MKYILIKITLHVILLIFSSSLLFAHGGEKHKKKNSTEINKQKEKRTIQKPTPSKTNRKNTIYQEINTAYLSSIKPIFEKKCFDCHGTLTKKPWYYDIPGISYMIQKDIKEAKKHMDMRQDFPFVSHESPYNDLKSIKDIALKGGMPPLKYIIGHWDSTLTDDESKALLNWSKYAMEYIKKEGIFNNK